MKAVVWEKKIGQVSLETVPKPTIKDPLDAVVRLTSAGICGSDLHIIHGRIAAPAGLTLGHEMIGIVEEVGEGVEPELLQAGDRVVVWAIVACGKCDNCVRGLTSYCITKEAGGFGFPFPEAYNGGQAEYVRVPWSTFNCIKVPNGNANELDYLLLSDIWPTAWDAVTKSEFQPGDVVAVFGAGPVGLLAAYSALLRGASKVYSIDHVAERLKAAQKIGAIPINMFEEDAVTQILALEPAGVDRAVEAVGFECVNNQGKNEVAFTINQCIKVVKTTAGIGVIGVFYNDDAGAPTAAEKKGILPIAYGEAWAKGLSIKGGAADIRDQVVPMIKLIQSGRGKPSFVIDTEVSINDAKEAYKDFSNKEIIKAVLRFDTPAAPTPAGSDAAAVANGATPAKKRRRQA